MLLADTGFISVFTWKEYIDGITTASKFKTGKKYKLVSSYYWYYTYAHKKDTWCDPQQYYTSESDLKKELELYTDVFV